MCTLILLHKVFPDCPIVVAANRDERASRPSKGFHNWGNGILAPKDKTRGGTWIGCNQYGIFAGLTNNDNASPHRKGMKARGQLLVDVLKQTTLADAIEILRRVSANDYNGFHMIMADKDNCFNAICNNYNSIHIRLATYNSYTKPYVITAYGILYRHCDRANTIYNIYKKDIEPISKQTTISKLLQPEMVNKLDSMLNFHNEDPKAGCCIHNETESHKTISSSIIMGGNDCFAAFERNGFACSAPFDKYSVLGIDIKYPDWQKKAMDEGWVKPIDLG